MAQQEFSEGAAAWRAYWRRGGVEDFSASGDVVSGVLAAFWADYLGGMAPPHEQRPAIDLACGSGALLRRLSGALSVAGAKNLAVGVDIAPDALARARQAAPEARLIAAALTRLPLPDGCAGLAVSQHGIEYGGDGAFREAARILAPGGEFAAVIHDADGGLLAESRHNLRFFELFSDREILPIARAALLEPGNAAAAPDLARRLAAIGGELSAGDNGSASFAFLRRVDADLRHMLPRRARYKRSDTHAWLNNVESELNSYIARIRDLATAAKDEAAIKRIASDFRQTGLEADEPRRLYSGTAGTSAGWMLIARRPAPGG